MGVLSLIDNPVILGLLLFVIVRVVKLMKWVEGGKESLWLTMGVAVLVAAVDMVAGGRLANLSSPPPTGLHEPLVLLGYVVAMMEVIVGNAGVVFASSQVIYHTLRQVPAARSRL